MGRVSWVVSSWGLSSWVFGRVVWLDSRRRSLTVEAESGATERCGLWCVARTSRGAAPAAGKRHAPANQTLSRPGCVPGTERGGLARPSLSAARADGDGRRAVEVGEPKFSRELRYHLDVTRSRLRGDGTDPASRSCGVGLAWLGRAPASAGFLSASHAASPKAVGAAAPSSHRGSTRTPPPPPRDAAGASCAIAGGMKVAMAPEAGGRRSTRASGRWAAPRAQPPRGRRRLESRQQSSQGLPRPHSRCPPAWMLSEGRSGR